MKSDRYKDRFEFYKAGSKEPHIIVNVSQDYSPKVLGKEEEVCKKPVIAKLKGNDDMETISKYYYDKPYSELTDEQRNYVRKQLTVIEERKKGSSFGDISDLFTPGGKKKTTKDILEQMEMEKEETKELQDEEAKLRAEEREEKEREFEERMQEEELARIEMERERIEMSGEEYQEPDEEYNEYVKKAQKKKEKVIVEKPVKQDEDMLNPEEMGRLKKELKEAGVE